MRSTLHDHPERHSIGLQLQRHPLLAELDAEGHAELQQLLVIQDAQRGECLVEQGGNELRQLFVLDGLLKRVVTSPEGREIALRFAGEGDMETCYFPWRRKSRVPFSIVCAKRSRVAALSMAQWSEFIERHEAVYHAYHDHVALLGVAIADHAIGLLLLDAPGRMQRFTCTHPELVDRVPRKDLASHLNLAAETLCRLSRRVTPNAGAMHVPLPFSGAA
jgi:CRP-like cAMP-binding protein